jgi:catechol 2,3-dioxygenase-like lactoylglutathione lyase family enzyme
LTLQSAVPILPSRDLDETRTFYERLGFSMSGGIYDDYMLLGREAAELHFFLKPNVDPLTTDFSCYLRVDSADALYEEWAALRIPHDAATGSRLIAPVDTDYGMREFALVDRSGNLLRIGSGG